jgi:hypothetical protein
LVVWYEADLNACLYKKERKAQPIGSAVGG